MSNHISTSGRSHALNPNPLTPEWKFSAFPTFVPFGVGCSRVIIAHPLFIAIAPTGNSL
jgi:hypothetical protein